MRDFFRQKLVQMGVTADRVRGRGTDGRDAEPAARPAVALPAGRGGHAQAQAVKAQADTEYTMARAEETRAKTIETLASVEND